MHAHSQHISQHEIPDGASPRGWWLPPSNVDVHPGGFNRPGLIRRSTGVKQCCHAVRGRCKCVPHWKHAHCKIHRGAGDSRIRPCAQTPFASGSRLPMFQAIRLEYSTAAIAPTTTNGDSKHRIPPCPMEGTGTERDTQLILVPLAGPGAMCTWRLCSLRGIK